MDLSNFDKSPHMTPLLVRLYDSHKFYGLVKDNKPLARAELTRAVTDLFETRLTAKEQELLADVLIGLMRQAEKDLRLALSEKLAALPNVPLRLILHLANDEITIAAPVLRKSIVLSDLDLIYIIKSQGPDYWQAIAARGDLSNAVADVLADTRDIGTALVLTQNDRIKLTRHALNVLGELAEENDLVAKPLLMRSDIPPDLARRLYNHVGRELQDYIKAFFGIDEAPAAKTVVEDLFIEFGEAAPHPEFMPSDEMVEEARKKAALNQLNLDLMMETLNKGMIPSFIAQFSEYTGISARRIHDFLRQPCPKGMAIACRAFRIQKSDFSRIYLMTNRMRSRDRLVNHKDMLDVLKYFDKVRPEVAFRIVMRPASEA